LRELLGPPEAPGGPPGGQRTPCPAARRGTSGPQRLLGGPRGPPGASGGAKGSRAPRRAPGGPPGTRRGAPGGPPGCPKTLCPCSCRRGTCPRAPGGPSGALGPRLSRMVTRAAEPQGPQGLGPRPGGWSSRSSGGPLESAGSPALPGPPGAGGPPGPLDPGLGPGVPGAPLSPPTPRAPDDPGGPPCRAAGPQERLVQRPRGGSVRKNDPGTLRAPGRPPGAWGLGPFPSPPQRAARAPMSRASRTQGPRDPSPIGLGCRGARRVISLTTLEGPQGS